MTINERIRFLRKEYLQKSQTEFALLIGMKQTSVSSFEQIGATVTDQTIKSICFAVDGLNENWLRNGDKPMFLKTPTETIEQLKEKFHLDEFAYGFVSEYLKLDKEKRNLFQNFFYNVLSYTNIQKSNDDNKVNLSSNKVTSNNLESTKLSLPQKALEEMSLEELAITREKEEAEYIKSDSNFARRTTSSVLNFTTDTQNLKNKDTNNKVSNH